MSRQEQIKFYGIEVVEAHEKYWFKLGYKIDYNKGLLVKVKE